MSDGQPSQRKELLHNIDILYPPKGASLYPDIFDTRVRAAIRVGEYKLITGDPGKFIFMDAASFAFLFNPKVKQGNGLFDDVSDDYGDDGVDDNDGDSNENRSRQKQLFV